MRKTTNKLHKKRCADALGLIRRAGAGAGFHASRSRDEARLPRKSKHKKKPSPTGD